ncbi:MAG: ADP-forming succinate--CoA ligase subunit beta [Myxococcota bacterium]
MKIHEYQAKELLRQYGIPTLEGRLSSTLDQVVSASDALGYPCVVKAQVHAGGRGKGGGIKLVKSRQEAESAAEALLGKQLITPQTGSEGQKINSVWVEKGCAIAKEYYAGLVLDRAKGQVCLMVSAEGGVDIEEVAAHHPEKILKEWVNPATGLMAYQARHIAYDLGLTDAQAKKLAPLLVSLYTAYISTDAALMEINPLVLTKADEWVALDAKIDFDDNALFRHKGIAQLQDPSQEDPRETMAQHHGLSYIALDGNIGCMVNGAGLAMATMDIIKKVGGDPANFLDVGGSASQQKVTEALKIILQDTKVKAVLINVFGGIAKCDVIAAGVVAAVAELGLHIPLIVRLEGTHVMEGREILAKSGLKIIPAENLLDAAQKAVSAARSL